MSRQLMGMREYARHREANGLPGQTLRAVQRAIETGRISTVSDEKGRQRIDAEVADIQWNRNTDPDQSDRASAGRASAARRPTVAPRSAGANDPAGAFMEFITDKLPAQIFDPYAVWAVAHDSGLSLNGAESIRLAQHLANWYMTVTNNKERSFRYSLGARLMVRPGSAEFNALAADIEKALPATT